MKNTLQRIVQLLLPCLLLLSLTACGQKKFDLTQFTINGETTLPETIVLQSGIQDRYTVGLPEGVEQMEVSAPEDTIQYELDGATILLSGDGEADTTLTLTLTGEGYAPTKVQLPVQVQLRTMEFSVLTGDEGSPLSDIQLAYGETLSLPIYSSADPALSLTLEDGELATAQLTAEGLFLQGDQVGETTLTLTATQEYYATQTITLPVTIVPASPKLQAAQSTLQVVRGKATSLSMSHQGGALTYSCDPDALDVTIGAQALSFTGKKTGTYPVTVTCSGDGYHTETASLSITVVDPPVAFAAMEAVTLTMEDTKTISLGLTPTDSAVTVSVSGSAVEAKVENGSLVVEGTGVGTATVTLQATADGYTKGTTSVTVTVNAKPVVARYSDQAAEVFRLTNSRRSKAGVDSLTRDSNLDMIAQKRAEEASKNWSHTRPDGTTFDTIFEEYNLTAPTYHGRGENLFAANLLDSKVAVDGWMDSPGHKENILRTEYTHMGVGIIKGSDGEYYYCQLFSFSK